VSDWERILYRALYAAGLRPIPQFSVEQYDLDLAIVVGERRLDIEVDGERYHRSWTGELCLRDQLRNMRLIELGWEVRRFWVYEVRDQLGECVEWVRRWAAAAEGAAG
jgi:very-short-patch-repair endonuclease